MPYQFYLSVVLIVSLAVLSGCAEQTSSDASNTDTPGAPEITDALPSTESGPPSSEDGSMSGSMEGIILVECREQTILSAIDPSTGARGDQRSFDSRAAIESAGFQVPHWFRLDSTSREGSGMPCNSHNLNAAVPLVLRHTFDPELQRMAVWFTGEGVSRVGWVDESGTLTDVTDRLHEGGDFATPPSHGNPVFLADGRFAYHDMNTEEVVFVEGSGESVVEDERRAACGSAMDYYAIFVLTEKDDVVCGIQSSASGFGSGTALPNLTNGRIASGTMPSYNESIGLPQEWVGDNEAAYEGSQSRLLVVSVGEDGDPGAERELVSGDGGRNRTPVVAPDGEDLAFLADRESPIIYTVGINGNEEPVRVTEIEDTGSLSVGENIYLMEWRR